MTFLWVGKTRNPHWAALEQEYLGRINHFVPSQIRIARQAKGSSRAGDTMRILQQEGRAILKHLRTGAYAVLLDERGTLLTSPNLAALIERQQNGGVKEMIFIVGGASGVADAVAHRADFRLALSPLTFPHEMARVILLEQIYRAFAIIHSLPYPR